MLDQVATSLECAGNPRGLTADIAFYVELARNVDGRLVELAIGNGRVAIPGRAG